MFSIYFNTMHPDIEYDAIHYDGQLPRHIDRSYLEYTALCAITCAVRSRKIIPMDYLGDIHYDVAKALCKYNTRWLYTGYIPEWLMGSHFSYPELGVCHSLNPQYSAPETKYSVEHHDWKPKRIKWQHQYCNNHYGFDITLNSRITIVNRWFYTGEVLGYLCGTAKLPNVPLCHIKHVGKILQGDILVLTPEYVTKLYAHNELHKLLSQDCGILMFTHNPLPNIHLTDHTVVHTCEYQNVSNSNTFWLTLQK
ncbi:MAG: hypothetical protein NC548_29410 [Lachnospiraceae bacterium]|nr:hypothetical protein [Lachnospiraceae bacterium]